MEEHETRRAERAQAAGAGRARVRAATSKKTVSPRKKVLLAAAAVASVLGASTSIGGVLGRMSTEPTSTDAAASDTPVVAAVSSDSTSTWTETGEDVWGDTDTATDSTSVSSGAEASSESSSAASSTTDSSLWGETDTSSVPSSPSVSGSSGVANTTSRAS